MEVDLKGGDKPPAPPGGGAKQRQRPASADVAMASGSAGCPPPPPPGPHSVIASELLPFHTAILHGLREVFHQNHQLAQGAMLMEQQRQAAEAARAMYDAEHRERRAAVFREVHATANNAAAAAERANL